MATNYVGGYAKAYGPYVQGGVVTPQLPPPANLRQLSTTSSSNTMTWDVVAGADSYELRRGSLSIYSGPALSFADAGLAAAMGYSYTVHALDSTGANLASAYSAAVIATTAAGGQGTNNYVAAGYVQAGYVS